MPHKIKDFYLGVIATNHVCEEIAKKNIHLSTKIEKETETIIDLSNASPYAMYLLSFVDSKKDLIIDIFRLMALYKFSEIESVEPNFNSFGPESSRYKHLSVVNLLDHTIHVAIEIAETMTKEQYPRQMVTTCIVLALLHDFGKAPQIILDFREETNQRHHKVSANFSKQYLVEYSQKHKKCGVNHNFIQTIYDTLFFHHDMDRKQNSAFIDILSKADRATSENLGH